METKCSASRAFTAFGNALPQHLSAWGIMMLTLMFLIAGPFERVTRADSITIETDDGPAKKDGTLKLTVTWKKGGEPKSVTVDVLVKTGDTSRAIRDKAGTALSANDMITADFNIADDSLIDSDFTSHAVFGFAKEGVQLIETKVANPDGIGGISLGVEGQFMTVSQGFFRVGGMFADANDQLSIVLVRTSPSLPSSELFRLPSYNGLSPDQIMRGLTSLIDQSPEYSASFVNGEVLIFNDFGNFGVDLIFSGTTNGTLTAEAGLRIVPEPTTIFLLVTGLIGVAIKTRKRLKNRKNG